MPSATRPLQSRRHTAAMNATLKLGVDLGGTKTEAVVLRAGGSEPEVLARSRVATEREGGYEHIVATTAQIIEDVAPEGGPRRASSAGGGDAGRGDVSPERRVPIRRPAGQEFEHHVPERPALSTRPLERRRVPAFRARRAASPSRTTPTASRWRKPATGRRAALAWPSASSWERALVAGSFFSSRRGPQRAWDEAQGIAGEWGHVVLDPASTRDCYCGRSGCVEQFLSGPAIEAAYAAHNRGAASPTSVPDRSRRRRSGGPRRHPLVLRARHRHRHQHRRP